MSIRSNGPSLPSRAPTSAVVVHGGARDNYQVALAMAESGLLESLVTDLFFPADRAWSRLVDRLAPAAFRELLRRRNHPALPSRLVRQCVGAGLRELFLPRLPRVSFALRRRSNRAADRTLGMAAGKLARRHHAGLVAYSYFAYDAMRAFGGPTLLFQVHPHPGTVRRLLLHELALHPDCASSLQQEWELALPEADFKHLAAEPQMASHLLAASSFTRDSLIEHGIPAHRITVVPYGVDLRRFHPAPRRAVADPRLHLLFVGRINQRKGIKYLLKALEMLPRELVRLTICGRVVDGLELFERFAGQVEIRPSVSEAELTAAYQQADLFVFPSVAEGFGQVLLEALACGLPILSTTHTAAPDLITSGVEGFIVEPGRPDLLAERIAWAAAHRPELERMRSAARSRAENFTWARFRGTVAFEVRRYLAGSERAKETVVDRPASRPAA